MLLTASQEQLVFTYWCAGIHDDAVLWQCNMFISVHFNIENSDIIQFFLELGIWAEIL